MSASRRKKLRYRVAGVLNRSERTCWESLVCWVEYGRPLRESFKTSGCFDPGWCEGQVCYCGKRGTDCPESVSTPVEVTK